MASKEIFPPIVETYMPAFLLSDGECRIYFSLSSYNTEEDILRKVQISIRNQNTNKTEFNINKATGGYPMGIKIQEYLYDTEKDMYYITIADSDLAESFRNNTYYKVQLRFISAAEVASGNVPLKPTSDWLNANLDAFSEWSTVCLIKGISDPTLKINIFPPAGVEEDLSDRHISLGTQLGTIVGRLTFKNTTESETLKSYRIKIYKIDDATAAQTLIVDSGIQYPTQTNEINYTIKKILDESFLYKVYIELITKNLFSWTPYYTFNINTSQGDPFEEAILSTQEDSENGRAIIKVSFKEDFADNLVIRRTSSETNFSEWEDISIKNLDLKRNALYIWYDYTIKSGVWYKYAIQKGESSGERSLAIISNPIMAIFSDIFLNSGNKQLRIKYNSSIDSFKPNIVESKTDTIGSKYPFFNRNSVVNYKSFSIGGLITFLSDIETSLVLEEEEGKLIDLSNENLFISKNNLFGEEVNKLYEEYNDNHNITLYNDFIYERAFREEVMNFLQSNTVKLFRSTPEGNLLVKIMDINFSPDQSLGRYVYSFQATAYEVADCSIENYDKYNIQQIGDFLPVSAKNVETITYNILGQVQYEDNSINVVNKILDKLKAQTTGQVKIKGYNYLKIDFQDSPYYIKNTDKGPILSNFEDSAAYLGYIITLNQKNIAINENGIYELNSEDDLYNITSLYCQGKCLIDYIVKVEVSEKNENYTISQQAIRTNKNIIYTKEISQLSGIFQYDTQLSKYLKSNYITNLDLSADENTCWEITFDNKISYYVLGKTELLALDNVIIRDIAPKGIAIPANEYNTKKIKIENNELYYLYKNEWVICIPYNYVEDEPKECPIENYQESDFLELSIDTEAIINYTYEREETY